MDLSTARKVGDFLIIGSILINLVITYLSWEYLRGIIFQEGPSHVLFELGLSALIGFMIFYYILERRGRAAWIEGLFLHFSRTERTEDNVEVLSDLFPAYFYSLLILSLSGVLWYDFYLAGRLSDPVYGLVFDGYGGALLAMDLVVLRREPGENHLIDVAHSDEAFVKGMWGMFFLISGFFLQILAISIRALPIP